jgi:hypothetical protein
MDSEMPSAPATSHSGWAGCVWEEVWEWVWDVMGGEW